MSGDTLDLFAGMGGFDLAARELGVDPFGIEWDSSACATRETAGLRTLQADVSQLDPLDFAPIDGLCAGPPCPAFSMAGNGEGRRALGFYRDTMARMADGETISAAELDEACGDDRAHLVLEPLRWALALRPRWVACEQVEPVLPLWEAMASALRSHGYWTAVGVLSAEQYGVPQTRRRAILLASLDRPVPMPAPTHQRYIAPRRHDEATTSLFDAPEPERIVAPEDRHLLPWVSMAQALTVVGCDKWSSPANGHQPMRTPTATATTASKLPDDADTSIALPMRPSMDPSLAASLSTTCAATDGAAKSPTSKRSPTARTSCEVPEHLHGTPPSCSVPKATSITFAQMASVAVPSATASEPLLAASMAEVSTPVIALTAPPATNTPLRTPSRSGKGQAANGQLGSVASAPATSDASTNGSDARPDSQPSVAQGVPGWRLRMTTMPNSAVRVLDDPAPTIAFGHDSASAAWINQRPATTVNGDPRISEPGHHDSNVSGSQQANAVRVSLAEALVLQSFPSDYPVQGTKTARYTQVGNAIPPLLAFHVLRAAGCGAL